MPPLPLVPSVNTVYNSCMRVLHFEKYLRSLENSRHIMKCDPNLSKYWEHPIILTVTYCPNTRIIPLAGLVASSVLTDWVTGTTAFGTRGISSLFWPVTLIMSALLDLKIDRLHGMGRSLRRPDAIPVGTTRLTWASQQLPTAIESPDAASCRVNVLDSGCGDLRTSYTAGNIRPRDQMLDFTQFLAFVISSFIGTLSPQASSMSPCQLSLYMGDINLQMRVLAEDK